MIELCCEYLSVRCTGLVSSGTSLTSWGEGPPLALVDYPSSIVTRNNIVWKLARGYCLCYGKTFSLVPDSTECSKKFFTEEYSTLFVPTKIK